MVTTYKLYKYCNTINCTINWTPIAVLLALGRFCGAEGLSNVKVGSTFRSSFGDDYGVAFKTGPLTKLLSRAVVVVGTDGKVLHNEQVAETGDEPNYEAALKVLG